MRRWREGLGWAQRFQMMPDLAAIAELLPQDERPVLTVGSEERILAPAILSGSSAS